MRRLYHIPMVKYREWRRARLDDGQTKYGDAHLQRYGVVDIKEELLDAQNIADLLRDRVTRSDLSEVGRADVYDAIETLQVGLDKLDYILLRIDRSLPHELCTDEQGGHRVWWSDVDVDE